MSHVSHRTVALEQVAIYAAYRVRLGADAASRPLPRIPGKQVEVQPVPGLGHEVFEKQGAEDRTGETRRGEVVEIRYLARELIVVSHPQRHCSGNVGGHELRVPNQRGRIRGSPCMKRDSVLLFAATFREHHMRLYSQKDVDKKALRGARIAVLGYGSQGRAHALNLHDSGFDVVVGVRKGDSWNKAKKDGLHVMEPKEAIKGAKLVAMLVPDMRQKALYEELKAAF